MQQIKPVIMEFAVQNILFQTWADARVAGFMMPSVFMLMRTPSISG